MPYNDPRREASIVVATLCISLGGSASACARADCTQQKASAGLGPGHRQVLLGVDVTREGELVLQTSKNRSERHQGVVTVLPRKTALPKRGHVCSSGHTVLMILECTGAGFAGAGVRGDVLGTWAVAFLAAVASRMGLKHI